MNLYREMFGFLDMVNNYDQRKVKNTETDEFTLDTCLVTDRSWNYETAVSHKRFNDGKWIVLEGCNDKETAEHIHDMWLGILNGGEVCELTDCYTGNSFKKQ